MASPGQRSDPASEGSDGARLSVRVSGRVQGVGFRQFTQASARQLGLTGWARNEYDGSVSAVAEGPRTNLERLLHALRTGPRMARVDDVSVQWSEPSGEFDTFSIAF